MILIDTHIWVWWATNHPALKRNVKRIIESHQATGLGVSVISCWEVAKLVQYGRLILAYSINEWMKSALSISGVALIPLTPEIAVESAQLPGSFHRDPADQILVATSRVMHLPLLTCDEKILNYQHVRTL